MKKKYIKKRIKEILAIENLNEIKIEYAKLLHSKDIESYEILLGLLASANTIYTILSAHYLALKGNPDYLSQMREINKKLPFRKGLRDYRDDVKRAIFILEQRQKGIKCNCSGYKLAIAYSDMYNPTSEKEDGFIEIVKSIIHQKEYYSDYFCLCKICHRRWKVTDEIGYHYPLYQWEEITFNTKYNIYFSHEEH